MKMNAKTSKCLILAKLVTKRFVEPDDIRHDMHVNIVTFKPVVGNSFAETHDGTWNIYS